MSIIFIKKITYITYDLKNDKIIKCIIKKFINRIYNREFMKKKDKARLGCLVFILIIIIFTTLINMIIINIKNHQKSKLYQTILQNLNYSINNYIIQKTNFDSKKFLSDEKSLMSMENFTNIYSNWGEFLENNLRTKDGKKIEIKYIDKKSGDIYLKNGIKFLSLANSKQTCSTKCYCIIEVDLNGDTGPNIHSIIENEKVKKLNDRFFIIILDYGAIPYIPSRYKLKDHACIKQIFENKKINLHNAQIETHFIIPPQNISNKTENIKFK